MLRIARSVVSSALAGTLLVSVAAAAAPPAPNDLRTDATVVAALPFIEEVNTAGATTSADDVIDCFDDAGSSIWYSFTGTAGSRLVVDALGSDYPVGIHIISDAFPDAVSCGIGHSTFPLWGVAGVTVSIQITDAFSAGGGNLSLAIYEPTLPANDAISAAVTISELPFEDAVDVTLATADADDAQAKNCGSSRDHTVWYKFTAGSDDTSLLVDTIDINSFGSSINIATGSPGALTPLTEANGRPICGFGELAFHTIPGTTYFILLGDPGSAKIPLTVSRAPLQPSLEVSFDPQGTINLQSGSANVTGTYECIGRIGAINVELTQEGGNHVIRFGVEGFSLDESDCDGNPHSFNVKIVGNPKRIVPPGVVSNPYLPGPAKVNGSGGVSNGWGFFNLNIPSTVIQLIR